MGDLITQLNRTHTQQQMIAMRSAPPLAGTVKRLAVGEIEQLVEKGEFRLPQEPILLQNGTGCCIKESDLRQWTAESMSGKDFSKVKMNFLSSRDKQLSRMGVRVPRKEISFSNYLSRCFSNKLPGSGTENCEVDLPLRSWLPREPPSDFNSRYDNITAQLGEIIPWSRLMTWREHIFEAGWNDIMTIREDLIERLYTGRLHRRLVVGPSGSGEELRPNPMGETLVDSLLHGSRRWLIVPYSELLRVSESAKEALEPTTAFIFFEEKLVELREEFGLRDYYECQQQPGETSECGEGEWGVRAPEPEASA
ncbi:hypothetical protein FOZ61_002031, partial [Perkinsus olseni]